MPASPAHAQSTTAAWRVTYHWTEHWSWYYFSDDWGGDSDSGTFVGTETDGGVVSSPTPPLLWAVGGADVWLSSGDAFLGASDATSITATLDRVDADGNPAPDPPKNVVVMERSLSNYIDTSGADTLIDGDADNGLGDPVQNYDNSGGYYEGYHRSSGPPPNDHSVPTRENAALPHYSVQDGSTGTITLPTRSLSCDIDCSRAAASPDPTDVMVGDYYMAAAYPVTIDITGGIGPPNSKQFLIGQGVTASLNTHGLPSSPTDTYSWSVEGGKPFDTYAASNGLAHYYPLFSMQTNTGQFVYCHFAKYDNATFICDANLAGQSVMVTQNVILKKPNATISVDMGFPEQKAGPKGDYVQLISNEAGAGTGEAAGIQWTCSVLTPPPFYVPAPLGSSTSAGDPGQWNWTQLITMSRQRQYKGAWEVIKSNTLTPPDANGVECLDGSYPYGGFWYPADDTLTGNADSPLEPLPQDSDYTEVNVHDSFRDYLMYQPPGDASVVVPLKRVKWFWQFDATQSLGAWLINNQDAAWSLDDDFPDHPEWTGYVSMGSFYYDSGN